MCRSEPLPEEEEEEEDYNYAEEYTTLPSSDPGSVVALLSVPEEKEAATEKGNNVIHVIRHPTYLLTYL